MTPKEVLREWIDCFNAADAARIVELYADDAVNHQVANDSGKGGVVRDVRQRVCGGRDSLHRGKYLRRAILEWKDPLGLRGCGFFHVKNDKIIFQRGYWDKLSFLKQHNLPIE